MKAAFFYSRMCDLSVARFDNFSIAEIDGKRFTECVSLDDDAEVKPYSIWEDNKLITVVENVDVISYGEDLNTTSYYSGPLQGRIKINGKVQ